MPRDLSLEHRGHLSYDLPHPRRRVQVRHLLEVLPTLLPQVRLQPVADHNMVHHVHGLHRLRPLGVGVLHDGNHRRDDGSPGDTAEQHAGDGHQKFGLVMCHGPHIPIANPRQGVQSPMHAEQVRVHHLHRRGVHVRRVVLLQPRPLGPGPIHAGHADHDDPAGQTMGAQEHPRKRGANRPDAVRDLDLQLPSLQQPGHPYQPQKPAKSQCAAQIIRQPCALHTGVVQEIEQVVERDHRQEVHEKVGLQIFPGNAAVFVQITRSVRRRNLQEELHQRVNHEDNVADDVHPRRPRMRLPVRPRSPGQHDRVQDTIHRQAREHHGVPDSDDPVVGVDSGRERGEPIVYLVLGLLDLQVEGAAGLAGPLCVQHRRRLATRHERIRRVSH
mmetsp:Transcript_46657/g.123249  ORF Transcript_46657/g.123249 Transcript_46657/m.123249 type:complete len:386 (-) Transcript_46657:44-1201(-)